MTGRPPIPIGTAPISSLGSTMKGQHATDVTAVPWPSYQMRKIMGYACAENTGNVFPATDFKVNRKLAIPACITARASRTCRDVCRLTRSLTHGGGEMFPAFPAHAQPSILRIWQEVHGVSNHQQLGSSKLHRRQIPSATMRYIMDKYFASVILTHRISRCCIFLYHCHILLVDVLYSVPF